MKYYISFWQNAFEFNGRASRKEYWIPFLMNIVVVFILSVIDGLFWLVLDDNGEYGVLSTLFQVIQIIPSIAVGVRRMHDGGHSGWFIIVPFINLLFCALEGQKGTNQYGEEPKN